MHKKYDAVATIGKYTNKQGEEKKRYMTVGSVFEDDQGRMSLKLDGVPCSPDWSGWISFYEPKQQDGPREQSRPKLPAAPARQAALASYDEEEDDIPF